MENRDVMEEFAVIGLDTPDKKAEAEAILKELGYRSYEDWNKRYRGSLYCDFIVSYKTGSYTYHTHDGDEPHITLDQLKEKVKPNKIGDVVVKVQSEEHGKEVIQAFKDLGVDPKGCSGTVNGYYYGLIDGDFSLYNTPRNSKVITLEELKAMKKEDKPTYPCMMEVWDKGIKPKLRKVIADFYTPKGVKRYVAISADGYSTRPFDSARQIQPDPLKEVIEKLKSDSVTLTHNEAQLIIDALEKNN